jgi:hypothetical protein
VAVLGPSLGNVVLALTVIGWVGYARLVRRQVLRAQSSSTWSRLVRWAPGRCAHLPGTCCQRHCLQ